MTTENTAKKTGTRKVELPSIPAKQNYDIELLAKAEKTVEIITGQRFEGTLQGMHRDYLAAIDVAEKYAELNFKILQGEITREAILPSGGGVVKLSWYDRLATDIGLGRTIAVRGPAGNGKSTGVKAVLEAAGYKVYTMDCTDSTTVDQLVGGIVPEADGKGGINMVFKPGVFAKAFSDEKAAIQLDEFDALDPRVAMCLQSALHRAPAGKKRWLSLPDHPEGGMFAKGDIPVVVTMNTWGNGATREYVGRNSLDAASMDRFNSLIDTNYEAENNILAAHGFRSTVANEVVAWANDIRKKIDSKGLRVVLSTRRLLDIAEVMDKMSETLKKATERDFWSRLEEIDRKALGN